MAALLRRRLTVTASTLRPRSVAFKARDRAAPARGGLAADRGRAHQADAVQDVPAGRRLGGACADGIEPAHRQDRARGRTVGRRANRGQGMTSKRRALVAANWKMNGSLDRQRGLGGDLRAEGGPAPLRRRRLRAVRVPVHARPVAGTRGARCAGCVGADRRRIHRRRVGRDARRRRLPLGDRRPFGAPTAARRERRGRRRQGGARAARRACGRSSASARRWPSAKRGAPQEVVSAQLAAVLEAIGPDGLARGALAYEPVWAIGTGRNATPAQAQEVHAASACAGRGPRRRGRDRPAHPLRRQRQAGERRGTVFQARHRRRVDRWRIAVGARFPCHLRRRPHLGILEELSWLG